MVATSRHTVLMPLVVVLPVVRVQGLKLTQQPFVAWHVVLSGGNGLRLVRYLTCCEVCICVCM